MKLLRGVLFVLALLIGALLIDANEQTEKEQGGDSGGGGQGGVLQCKKVDSGGLILRKVESHVYTYGTVVDDEVIIGPPEKLTKGDSSATFACTSAYMQTTEASKSGWFQVKGRCLTVDATALTVTLAACISKDGPAVANQFFVEAQDAGGVYAKFLGGPPGQTLNIGFRVDDADPEGRIVAVEGRGGFSFALEP